MNYEPIERNEMTLRDVRIDAAVEVQPFASTKHGPIDVAYVVALKRCGCTGPLLGAVEIVDEEAWPRDEDLPQMPAEAPEEGLTLGAAWAEEPGRRPRVHPGAYEWDMMSAARALRSWHAMRALRGAIRRSERRREAA